MAAVIDILHCTFLFLDSFFIFIFFLKNKKILNVFTKQKLFDIESQSKLKNVKPSQKNQAWPQNSGQAKPKNQAKLKSQAKPKIKPSHKIKPSQVLKSSQAKLKVKHAWKINFVGFSLAWSSQAKVKPS